MKNLATKFAVAIAAFCFISFSASAQDYKGSKVYVGNGANKVYHSNKKCSALSGENRTEGKRKDLQAKGFTYCATCAQYEKDQKIKEEQEKQQKKVEKEQKKAEKAQKEAEKKAEKAKKEAEKKQKELEKAQKKAEKEAKQKEKLAEKAAKEQKKLEKQQKKAAKAAAKAAAA